MDTHLCCLKPYSVKIDSWSRRSRIVSLAMACVVLCSQPVSAGICWQSKSPSSGRCSGMIERHVSKADCCRGSPANRAWTPLDATNSRLFIWISFHKGAPDCQSCHNLCRSVKCPIGKSCRIRNGRPRCICSPDCQQHRGRHRGELCGDDGNNYRNYCALLKHNCRHNKNVYVNYFSRCKRSCSQVNCHDGKRCIVDQNAVPHCIECRRCPATPALLAGALRYCGTDTRTYTSVCAVRYQTCARGDPVGIAYHGNCIEGATCRSITCPDGKQCLVDFVTRRPRCFRCNSPCYGPKMTLCGTNGVTYNSYCDMKRLSCQQGVYIQAKHSGACSG